MRQQLTPPRPVVMVTIGERTPQTRLRGRETAGTTEALRQNWPGDCPGSQLSTDGSRPPNTLRNVSLHSHPRRIDPEKPRISFYFLGFVGCVKDAAAHEAPGRHFAANSSSTF